MKEVLKDQVIDGQRWRLGAKKREDLLRDYRCAARRLDCSCVFPCWYRPCVCGVCMCIHATYVVSEPLHRQPPCSQMRIGSQPVLQASNRHLAVPHALQAHARPAAQRGWRQLST